MDEATLFDKLDAQAFEVERLKEVQKDILQEMKILNGHLKLISVILQTRLR